MHMHSTVLKSALAKSCTVVIVFCDVCTLYSLMCMICTCVLVCLEEHKYLLTYNYAHMHCTCVAVCSYVQI